jgi:large subunit ribosomal protein L4
MTSAQVVDLKGKKLSEVALSDAVFGIKPNMGVIHNALVRQLANARQGSANTKTRAEVRGGGRKPWRQKGTGRARAGSIRSPLWAGGGVPFGPKPRDYSITMNKKMRVLALKSALAASVEKLVVVQDFDNLKEAKTKLFSQVLKDLGHVGKKVLVVLDYACDACARVERAARKYRRVLK